MKLISKLSVLLIISSALILNSCKKDAPTPDEHDDHDHTTTMPTKGDLQIKFENKYGSSNLVLNTVNYTNNTDTFKVSTFNYYISNIKVTASDNTVFSEPESYHLIKASESASLQFTLKDLPVKNYTSISFMIGVDSTRNVSGSQTGALDPTNGHFWSWNSGYIMAKFEGTSPQSGASNKALTYHVGGFKGVNTVLKNVTINLNSAAIVNGTKVPQIVLNADLKEWFSPNNVNFSSMHTIHMPGSMAKTIADNYENMFSLNQVIN